MSNIVPAKNSLAALMGVNPLASAMTARDTPLGTAEWLRTGGATLQPFREGDFYLGKLSTGPEVGFRDDRHALIAAGARSGKGASVIVPNLAYWPGSMVVIDPKGENAKVCARRRSTGSSYCKGRGQRTSILDPFDEVRTPEDNFSDLAGSFNPLDMISVGSEESVDIAARIAESLIVSDNPSDPIWDNSAKDALKGVILHVASSRDFLREDRNLVTVQKLFRAGDERARKIAEATGPVDVNPTGMTALFDSMSRNRHFAGVIADIGTQLGELAQSPRTLAGVLQVVRVNLGFMDSPGIRRCLSASTFAMADLKTLHGGFSLFMCLPQRFMETHYRWLRMMTELVVGEMEHVAQQPVTRYPVLILLDEFPALKRMRVLENAAAQIAGFGVKLVFVVQTLAQLKDIYKDNWETFISNAGVKLFFCNDDHFTRKYVSELIGDAEVTRTTRSASHSDGSSSSDSTSTSRGYSGGISTGGSSGQSTGGKGGGTNSGASFSLTSGSSYTSSNSQTHGSNSSETQGLNESIHKRALVSPDEVGRLFGDRNNPTGLALISGYQPLFLIRAAYFGSLRWAGLYDAHPDHPRPLRLEHIDAAQREQGRKESEARRCAAAAQKLLEDEKARKKAQEQAELDRQRRDYQIERNEWLAQRDRRQLLIGLVWWSVGALSLLGTLWIFAHAFFPATIPDLAGALASFVRMVLWHTLFRFF